MFQLDGVVNRLHRFVGSNIFFDQKQYETNDILIALEPYSIVRPIHDENFDKYIQVFENILAAQKGIAITFVNADQLVFTKKKYDQLRSHRTYYILNDPKENSLSLDIILNSITYSQKQILQIVGQTDAGQNGIGGTIAAIDRILTANKYTTELLTTAIYLRKYQVQ